MGKIFRNLVPFLRAIAIAYENSPLQENTERVPIEDCSGRISAEDVFSIVPLPPFSRSVVDGYAVLSEDLASASPDNHIHLEAKYSAEIGNPPIAHPGHGFCVPIATGAVMPLNCDSVIMIENTTIKGNRVEFSKSAAQWENVAHAGEDMPSGSMILRKGSKIESTTIGILGAAGVHDVLLYRKVRIGVASSGNELLMPGVSLPEGKLYESNSTYVLSELSRFRNVTAKRYALMHDNLDEISAAMTKMLQENDAIIVSGGTSAGEGDYVYRALETKTPGILFHGVAVKPGTPTVFAVVDKKPVFGLPGFPVSAMMIFMTIFLPAVLRMAREPRVEKTMKVTLGMKTLIRIGYTSLVILRLVKRNGSVIAYPVNGASGSISRLLDAEGFAVIEGDRKYVESGEQVTAYLLRDNLPETVFLGIPDTVATAFISSLDSMPAMVKLGEDAIPTFVREISPDFASVATPEIGTQVPLAGYSSILDYEVSYGIYFSGTSLEKDVVVRNVLKNPEKAVSISRSDAVALTFRKYISSLTDVKSGFHEKMSVLPTPESCIMSLKSGEKYAFVGLRMRPDPEGINFVELGRIRKSIIASTDRFDVKRLERAINSAREAITELAS